VTETAGTAFAFTVSTKGYPTPALSAGTLPSGVSFVDNGNGTGTLAGTTSVAAGTYSVTITAANAGGSANQVIALTVKTDSTKVPVPAFTSAATATATAGKAFTFTVTTTGSPTTTYSTSVTHTGTLPSGLSFNNLGNGTATISGTPTAASGGTYALTLTAKNSAGTTTQSFVLTVQAGPTITSAATAAATDGSAFNFTVKTSGSPAPALSETGALPSGVTFTDNGNGTATLAGTPGLDQGGVYKLTVTAANTFGSATQSFTLTVDQAPAITSASSAPATHGKTFSFTFTATGYPLPTVTHTGTVKGLTYTRGTNGTATLSGTPTTAGTYTLTITATNSVGTATQTFTLTVS
jgi:PKD repeat protein